MGRDGVYIRIRRHAYIARHEHGNAVVRLEEDLSSIYRMLMPTSAVLNMHESTGTSGGHVGWAR